MNAGSLGRRAARAFGHGIEDGRCGPGGLAAIVGLGLRIPEKAKRGRKRKGEAA